MSVSRRTGWLRLVVSGDGSCQVPKFACLWRSALQPSWSSLSLAILVPLRTVTKASGACVRLSLTVGDGWGVEGEAAAVGGDGWPLLSGAAVLVP